MATPDETVDQLRALTDALDACACSDLCEKCDDNLDDIQEVARRARSAGK